MPWPHQVEPVLALIETGCTRLLVADAVGLGKTLTAALVLTELSARGIGERALLLVPAGLRDQWQDELRRHVALDAEVVDWIALTRRSRQAFAGASPWSAPGCAIVSLDFAKQPTVLAGLARSIWDVLVVDEAHEASGDSARAAAVARLGRRSRIVLLLTATPHGGDPRAFRALTSIGAARDAPMTWFRHEREAARPGARRRTRTWHPRATPAERAMHAALRRYGARVERTGRAEARLALVVLKKRALSSAAALGRSLDHRRRLIADTPGAQLLLPLDGWPGETETTDVELPALLGAPAFDDSAREVDELDRLQTLAGAAAAAPSKWRVIDRLLGSTREPAILFTEYRDTLNALVAYLSPRLQVAVLHGGLTREERAASLEQFTTGGARVLAATDAAAEGLNLQARCRLVVNVELPWSPVRLEQRVGRVDRIGQARAVHEWRLAGAQGHETAVLAALARRAAAITADLGRVGGGIGPVPPSPADAEPMPGHGIRVPAAAVAARAATAVVAAASAAALRRAAARPGTAEEALRGPRIVTLGRRPPGTSRGVIVVFSVLPGAAGDLAARVAVHVEMARLPAGSAKRWLPWVVARALPVARSAVPRPAVLVKALAARERALRDADDRDDRPGRWQPSLFDRRAERILAAASAESSQLERERAERLADLAAAGATAELEPWLALLVP